MNVPTSYYSTFATRSNNRLLQLVSQVNEAEVDETRDFPLKAFVFKAEKLSRNTTSLIHVSSNSCIDVYESIMNVVYKQLR